MPLTIHDLVLCRVLMVVGAGRGPLVRAAINATKQADRKVKKIYAVEKNPNAVITYVLMSTHGSILCFMEF